MKPPNWFPKFPSACNLHGEALRWIVSPGEWKAQKGADGALSARLSSRHFTQEAIKVRLAADQAGNLETAVWKTNSGN